MKKAITALILMLSLLITGCAQRSCGTVSYGKNLMAGIQAKTVPDVQAAADSADFALNLLKAAYDGGNTLVSPASAYLALSMVANGAAGETLKEFETVLGAPVGELNGTCKALMEALYSTSDGLTLKSVNGIWYDLSQGFAPNREFLQTNADYFGAAAVASDFSNSKTLGAINNFVSDNTNGQIPSILEELKQDDVMVLINTLYFKSLWKDQFDPLLTADGGFTLSNGKRVTSPFMSQTYGDVASFDSDGIKGVIIPYKDERFAFVAVLPDQGIDAFLSSLTADGFKSLLSAAEKGFAELRIPKFDVTEKYKLNDILRVMGIVSAFDSEAADFSSMGGNLHLGRVLQNTAFKLGEKGTEAAAATAAVMASAMPQNRIELNRPFVYALMDMESMTPLFLGVLEDPTATS